MLNPLISNKVNERKNNDFSVTNSESNVRGLTLMETETSEPYADRPHTCFVRAPFSLLFKGPECICSSRGAVAIHSADSPEEDHSQAQRLRFQAVFNSKSVLWST